MALHIIQKHLSVRLFKVTVVSTDDHSRLILSLVIIEHLITSIFFLKEKCLLQTNICLKVETILLKHCFLCVYSVNIAN